MKNNNIQRLLASALLLAFTAPTGFTYPTHSGYDSYDSANNRTYSAGTSTDLSATVPLSNTNEKITLSLRDSDVQQVLRMFADKAGKNIVFHSTVKGKVTLDLVDMPINEAFNLVLQINNLSYYIQDNTLIVLSSSSKDNANFSKKEMMVFPVQYVAASKVADFLNKNVFGMKKPGMSTIDAATVNAATNEVIVFGMPTDAAVVRKVIAQLDKEPLSRTFYVNHTTPGEMADMICNMLLPSQGASSGGGSGKSNGNDGYTPPTPGVGTSLTGGAAGIVTGGADGIDDTIKLGEGIVACSVSQSAKGSSSSFDVQNLAVSYYPQRGSIMLIGGSEAQQRLVENFIKTNDIKQPQAYLEMSIVELSEQGSKEFQNNWSVASKAWNVSFNNGRTTGGRPGGVGESWSPYIFRGWTNDASGTNPQMIPPASKDSGSQGYTLPTYGEAQGYLPWKGGGRSYISWTMNYLIENNKARVLANPKIIITNGKTSVIDLTEDYVEKVTSEFLSSSQNGNGSTGTVQRTYTIGKDKGIKISLVPFISPDGYVTLNILPQYATEAGQIYATGETGQSELAATLLNRRNLDLKNVRIKDGETLVIGGMISEGDYKQVQKIPVLGDLPLIGAAFRSTSTKKQKSELVIMITPKIIVDGDEVAADRL